MTIQGVPTVTVLDHGFVKLRNLAGPTPRRDMRAEIMRPFDADDIDPAQAARMSFEQMDSDRTYEQDMKLNRYLLVNGHTSPFEMIQVWVEVKVPIFVDRQLVRHRTWRRNESSGRYITLPAEWYIPEVVGGKVRHRTWRRNESSARYITLPAEWYIPEIVGGKAPNVKQGQEDNLPEWAQELFKTDLDAECQSGYNKYLWHIGQGVAPEHARMFLHLNHYVHWLGNVDLGNMFKFLALRAHSHAQIEAQAYAFAIIDLLRVYLPGLMKLFDEVVKKP